MIRDVNISDAEAICRIYNHYIERTTVTFEMTPVGVEEMRERIGDISQRFPYLVHESDGVADGFSYVDFFNPRAAYQGTVDVSIYVDAGSRSHGVGTVLMTRLIAECRRRGLHTIIALIVADNDSSLRFHRRMGFVECGRLISVGRKFGRILDVCYYQLTL